MDSGFKVKIEAKGEKEVASEKGQQGGTRFWVVSSRLRLRLRVRLRKKRQAERDKG